MTDQQAEAATRHVGTRHGRYGSVTTGACAATEEAWMQVYEFVYRITGRFQSPWLEREDMAQEIVRASG